MEFRIAATEQEFEVGKQLFRAYAAGLNIDLSFQSFEQELVNIQQQYSEPEGALVIVFTATGDPIGCFGIRKSEVGVCELKRMYLKAEYRGQGIGDQMMNALLDLAAKLGYQKIRLDTLSSMNSAVGLYRKYDFYLIDPYRFNPIEEALYFERKLP